MERIYNSVMEERSSGFRNVRDHNTNNSSVMDHPVQEEQFHPIFVQHKVNNDANNPIFSPD